MTPSITLLDEAVAHCDLKGFFKLPVRPAVFTLAPRHLAPCDDADQDFALGASDPDLQDSPVFVFAADADCPSPSRCTFTGCCGACQPPAA